MFKMKKNNKLITVTTMLEKNVIKSRIKVTDDLKQYFNTLCFYSIYDAEIFSDISINNVPVLSIILPVAWVTGSDVYVDILDVKFKMSMDRLQRVFKRIYPKAPFDTKLHVDSLAENNDGSTGTGLLFSGGLDSTFSLFNNISDKPSLVMMFGTDLPNSVPKFQEYVKDKYLIFAEKEGVKIHFIKTNALEVINERRLDHLFWKFQGKHEGNYWNGVGYALGHIGQVAPLSISRFNRLLIASAVDSVNANPFKIPDASSPLTDEIISWSDFHVEHDGFLNRYEKVLRLRGLFLKNRLQVRVCWADAGYLLSRDEINCNKCEKCLRTIAALVLSGIDPNECGFHIDNSTFNLMKYLLEKKILSKKHLDLWWKPIQQAIPDSIQKDYYGSRSFFEWFKTIDLDSLSGNYRTPLYVLYTFFPYWISNIFRKVFYDLRPIIKIYEPIEPRNHE